MRTSTFLIPAVLLLVGCGIGRGDCVNGTGEPVTREIPVARLNAIVVSGSMDVVVVRGDTQRVEVTAQPGLIDLLKTTVDNGSWEITTTKCFNSDRPFRIRITVPMLNSVIVEGSGDVESEEVYNTGKTYLEVSGSGSIAIDTVHEGRLEVVLEGSGSISVNGTCRELDYRSTGSGDLNASGLVANEADMDMTGSGSAEIGVISTLNAKLTGSGDLRYSGRPEVSTKVEGSGSVIASP